MKNDFDPAELNNESIDFDPEELDDEPQEEAPETAEELSARDSVYGEIREALIARGIPSKEIAFIHDHPTPVMKSKLFADVNAGKIRVLIGSTEKLGREPIFRNALLRYTTSPHATGPPTSSSVTAEYYARGIFSLKFTSSFTSPSLHSTLLCVGWSKPRRDSSTKSWPAR